MDHGHSLHAGILPVYCRLTFAFHLFVDRHVLTYSNLSQKSRAKTLIASINSLQKQPEENNGLGSQIATQMMGVEKRVIAVVDQSCINYWASKLKSNLNFNHCYATHQTTFYLKYFYPLSGAPGL